MVDYSAALFGPVYRAFSVPAVLQIGLLSYPDLRVIDKTAGSSLREGNVVVQSEIPAARIQAKQLIDLGISLDSLDGATLTFNGNSWGIASHKPLASPNGDADGEINLLLESNG